MMKKCIYAEQKKQTMHSQYKNMLYLPDEEYDNSDFKIIYSFTSDPPQTINSKKLSVLKNPDISIKDKLKSLECPFTWDMDNLCSDIIITVQPSILDEKSYDEEDSLLIFNVIIGLMELFAWQKQGEAFLLDEFDRANDLLNYITSSDDMEGLSVRALQHIMQATHCHILYDAGKIDELEKLLEKMDDPKYMDSNDKNTLEGCRGFAWLAFDPDHTEGKKYIQLALEGNPDCALWHYILGRHMRHIRRNISIHKEPCNQEMEYFSNVYHKSKNPKYALLAAEMFYEANKLDVALRMYKTIFNRGKLSDEMYLWLALGFTKMDAKALAEECFSRVKYTLRRRLMYLHYRGLFYKKLKQYQKAIKFLKKAIDPNDIPYFPAMEDYCFCMTKINKNFNVLQFLLLAINKYDDVFEVKKQRIVLHIAFEYYEKRNLIESLTYFHRAMKANPRNPLLHNYYYLKDPKRNVNIFKFLMTTLLKSVEPRRRSLNQDALKIYVELKQICEKYSAVEQRNRN